MIRAQLAGPRKFEFAELPTREPGQGEVLLEVACVAVCGSEFAPYLGLATDFPLYEHVVRYPRIVGREASAVVARARGLVAGALAIGWGRGRRCSRRMEHVREMGCQAITVADLPQGRLRMALELGRRTLFTPRGVTSSETCQCWVGGQPSLSSAVASRRFVLPASRRSRAGGPTIQAAERRSIPRGAG